MNRQVLVLALLVTLACSAGIQSQTTLVKEAKPSFLAKGASTEFWSMECNNCLENNSLFKCWRKKKCS